MSPSSPASVRRYRSVIFARRAVIRHTRCFECVSRKGFILQIPRAPGDGALSPRFGLSLLEGFELTGPDGVVDLPSKKLAGLLAYLACNAPRPQPRERLSALLWGSHFDG